MSVLYGASSREDTASIPEQFLTIEIACPRNSFSPNLCRYTRVRKMKNAQNLGICIKTRHPNIRNYSDIASLSQKNCFLIEKYNGFSVHLLAQRFYDLFCSLWVLHPILHWIWSFIPDYWISVLPLALTGFPWTEIGSALQCTIVHTLPWNVSVYIQ